MTIQAADLSQARALSAQRLGGEITLCGKRIEICPYTRHYLGANKP